MTVLLASERRLRLLEIVVGASDDTFDLTVGEQAVTNLAISRDYNTIEICAIQRTIDASGKFENELAVDVVVKEGTTVATQHAPLSMLLLKMLQVNTCSMVQRQVN